MKIGKNKKAEISTSFLISFIILVIGFAIILYIILSFNWAGTIDRETCHESVVYRSLNVKFIEAGRVVPLKCETEKVCFTMSGDDCSALTSTEKNPVRKVKLSSNKDIAKEKVESEIAESMVNCHWMLGEGKLDFMPHNNLEWENEKTNYGLICTRFAFDEKAAKELEDITHREMYTYLARKKYKEDQSYLEYLYPGWKNSGYALNIFDALKDSDDKNADALKNSNFNDWKIYPEYERGYTIIATMAPYGNFDAWLKGVGTAGLISAGTVVLASFIPGGWGLVGVTMLPLVVGGGVASGAMLWYSYNGEYLYSPPSIYLYDTEVLKMLKIHNFEIAPD